MSGEGGVGDTLYKIASSFFGFGGIGGGSPQAKGPTAAETYGYLREVALTYGTNSVQFRAAAQRYLIVYQKYRLEFARLPEFVGSVINSAGEYSPPRDLSWAAGLLTGTSVADAQVIGIARQIAGAVKFARSKSFGPFKRYSVGKKKQVIVHERENVFGKTKLPDEATVLGAPMPDWFKQIVVWTAAQAGIEGVFRDTAPQEPPQTWEEKQKAERDALFERERQQHQREVWRQEAEDRDRRIKQEAEDRAQAARDRAAPKPAPPAAPPPPPMAAKVPLWLQALGLAQEYYKNKLLAPKRTRVTQANVSNFPELQPGLTGFNAGGVSSGPCSCPAKPKRKRRKTSRSVCYTGRFIERLDGTTKYSKRKIQCRPSRRK